ncbi:uncharacterized protein LOC106668782 [Cimex lectularius]|uniref:Uncharacterized protein n=1 Tax=Cimex lectularius TaxID=79782 RepID=A0A8I6SBG3_CIMLE|nr:uncharacterized protein LOC106668782 [Cimex lectularius]
MDETLLLNKSIQDNGVLPNLQNNLLALDLMRKSGSDVENESMLVKYSPEPSIIKSIESHSFLNNTSLESIFPRGCQDNRLWAKSLKDSLNLSKTGNNSMNETLKTSPKNAMRRKLENKHKMDLTVNLTFNDTDKEISLSESSSKTNPFVKLANCKKYSVNLNLNDTDKEISLSESGSKTNPFVKLANCKKYSVNLNLNETTQLSSDVLGTISSAENSLLSEKPSENVFKTLNNIKYSPVIDLSLTENSEIEEEVRHPILASNGRRSKKYSVKFDLDSSCDSSKNKTVHTNNFSNLKNEDEQFDLITNKKIIDLKETRHDDTTKDKENQSFQIETPPCDSRRNGKVRSSSRKPKGKNSNQIGSATDDHKINASIVNSTKDESQTTMNTENVPTSTIECVEPSPRINKTELEKEKSVDHKAEETKLNKSKSSKKKSLQINTNSADHVGINNESQTERCVVECDQIVTHERSLSDNLLQNPVEKPFQNCLDTSNVEISTNVDSLNVTLKVPLDPKGKSKEHSAIEVEQSGLDVKHNSNVGELTSDHNYTVNLQGKNIKAPNDNIKENILKQLEEGKNDIVTARPDDLAHKDVSSVPVKKNLPKNKKKKSAKVVTEDISSRKTDSSLETTQMSQITDITLNVSSYESLDVSLDAQESYTQKECLAYHSSPMYKSRSKILNTLDQEVKCILKKDSMEYVETHVMDYVQSDSFDLDDCPMERPKLVEKNDSFRLVENCSNPFFPNINEVDNSSQVEIPYLSKTIIDELDSTSTESNLVVENQQELNLIRSSLENNKELQDENERENVISIPSKCTIDDNDEHANDCSSGVKTLSLENNNEVCLQTESQVDVISIPKFDDNNKEVNDGSNKVKTPSSSKQTTFEQTNNTNFENSQTKNKENDCRVGMEEQQKTQKMSQEFATADLLEDDLQHSNGTSQIAVVESIPEVINEKLVQRDIPQNAEKGEQHITESESDVNSHSGKSKQSNSQFKLVEDKRMSADDENDHVTTLIENNLPGKDNSFNFTIASEPSKQVSSHKSKTNTTNEAVNETTPAKRTRSSTRKSKMSDITINVNDKLAQKDIPQQAKEGERLITESESDANSHSGNSKQLESQFMLAKCSMVSANDENGHVTTLVENNLPGKDNSINFTIASEPSKQVSSQKSKINTTNEAVNETTPAKRTRSSTRKSKMSDKSINVNDKLAQKDIPQPAKEGEQHITESESDVNSHSGNSTQSKSQFKRVKRSRMSADEENGHVRTVVENNHPGKDDSINFAIPSLPSKRVSSRKSKANTTNVAVKETKTPTKRNRSSTRKSKTSDKTISNLSYDSSLDVSSINQSFPHKKVLIYHSTPFHKVPIKQSYRKAIYQADNVDNGVGQSNSRRSTRRNISVDQNNCIESIYNHDKSSVNEQFCTSSTRSKSRSSQQKNSLLETKDSFTVSNSQGDFDATSIDSNNSLNLNSKSIISQPPHLDPIEKHMLKIKTALNKNKRKQDSVFDSKEITSKKRKMANTFTLPKLYKPAKWVNKRLYQFLEKSLSDKYKLEARKVSEEFVITLYHTYTLVIHGHTEPSLSNLKAKLKELGLCRTQLDFFLFVINYMPFNFRKLVVPLSGAYNTPIQPKILPFDEL